MMKINRVLKWLLDIQHAIEEIEQFMPEGAIGFAFLQQNVMFKRALERNIEIIGEAVNRILADEPRISRFQVPDGLWILVILLFTNMKKYLMRYCGLAPHGIFLC